jgi:hypothetical protein
MVWEGMGSKWAFLGAVVIAFGFGGAHAADTGRDDGTEWTYHPLDPKFHCLLDDPHPDPNNPKGKVGVLYRDAPAGSSRTDELFLYLQGGGPAIQ